MKYGYFYTDTFILPRLDTFQFSPGDLAGLEFWGDTVDNQYVNGYLAADFVSANSEYLSSTSIDFDKADEDFSFGCWFKFDTVGRDEAIIGKWDTFSNTKSYLLTKTSSNFFKFNLSGDGSATTSVTWSSTAAATVWYFVVGVYDSVNDLMKLSINGQDFQTASFSGALFNSSEPFTISRFRAGGAGAYVYSDSQIDAPFFYDKALTLAECKAIYNAGAGTDISLLENHNNTQYAIGQSFTASNLDHFSSVSTDFDKGDEDFSFGGWIKFDALGTAQPFFGKWTNASRSYVITKGASNLIGFSISSDGTAGTTSAANFPSTVSTGTWYFVVGVYDSVNDLVKISLDGSDFVTASHVGGAFAAATPNLRVGLYNGSTGDIYLDGDVDGLLFYNKALSFAEVKALYNSGNGIGYPSLTSLNGNQYAIGQSFTAASSQSLSSTSTDFDKGNESFSFGGWFKVDSFVGTFDGIMGKYLATGNQRSYVLGCYDADDTWRFTISTDGTYSGGVTGQQISASTLVQFGVWQFVVCVYDATNDIMKISVNGENFVTASWSLGAFAASTADFEIGSASGFPSNVDIDSTFFYDKALSLAEVKAIYNSSNGVAYPSLTSLNGNQYAIAQDFTAASSQTLSSASNDFDFGDTDFSFGGWINVDALGSVEPVVGKWDNSTANNSFLLRKNISNDLTFFISNNGSTIVSVTSAAISASTWVFVTCVHDSVNDLIKISVNGAAFVTTAHTGGAWASSIEDLLFAKQSAISPIYGDLKIDSFFFYNKALSQTEVNDLYNGGSGLAYSSLTAAQQVSLLSWYEMNTIEGALQVDSHGTNNLTPNNRPVSTLGKVNDTTITSIESSLVSWWGMDDVEGALQTDSVTLSANDLTPVNTPVSTLGKVNDTTIATIESSLVSWYEMNSVEGALQVDSVTLSGNDLSAINKPVSTVGKVNDTTITTIESDLVSWWTLNQASGTRYDAVGTNDLTDNNTVGTATGKIQEYDLTYLRYRAASFNGTTDAIGINNSLTPLTATTQGTFSAWIKTDNLGTLQYIMAYANTTAAEFIRFYITSGKLAAGVRVAGTDYWTLATDSAILTTGWTHVALVHNGIEPIMYVNGVEYSVSALNASFAIDVDRSYWFNNTTLSNGRIGCLNFNSIGNTLFFDGSIDTVSVYSDAKSATEISDIYNGGTGQSYTDIDKTNLVAFYGFNDSNNIAADSTGNYDGFILGTPSSVAGKVLEPILNEGDNVYTWLDASGEGNNALQTTIANQPTYEGGNSIVFNGTTDYLISTSLATALATTTQGTWAAWVKPDAIASQAFISIVENIVSAVDSVSFAMGVTGSLEASGQLGGIQQWSLKTDSVVFNVGQWIHVAIVQDGIAPKFYVNGVEAASTFTVSTDTTYWINDMPVKDRFGIGAFVKSTPSSYLDGAIGTDLIITSSALTAVQVTQLYNYTKANYQ